MSSNLPPGVSPSDIPGNRPDDIAWERFEQWAYEKLYVLSLDEAYRAIKIGLAAIAAERGDIAKLIDLVRTDERMAVEAEWAQTQKEETKD